MDGGAWREFGRHCWLAFTRSGPYSGEWQDGYTAGYAKGVRDGSAAQRDLAAARDAVTGDGSESDESAS